MASATVSTRNRAQASAVDDSRLRWSRRWSLTARILAVNVFALAMLAGGILYLDSFRERLLETRRDEMRAQAVLIAGFVAEMRPTPQRLDALVRRFSTADGTRLRVYAGDGRPVADNWSGPARRFALRDPAAEPWRKDVARFLDRVIEGIGGAEIVPAYVEPRVDRRAAWREAETAARIRAVSDTPRRAPDRTYVIGTAAPILLPEASGGAPLPVVHLTEDARDITRVVRDERLTLFLIFLGVAALSLLVSSFLARTIVRPLRRLAIAAQRVRAGRSREVTVPRFAARRDEIGQLARALSDMTAALRQRIDATESFAADVAHEIKNPLASMRSAIESLGMVKDPALQAQLLEIVGDDVRRIDRLLTDISGASRLDAELSRSHFDQVDIGQMTATVARIAERDGLPRGVALAYARPEPGTAIVAGDEGRLGQVVRNLVDNAVSFSPDGGVVRLAVTQGDGEVRLRVDDDGPGVRPENMADIFKRFYSERPEGEDFGKHSGLGLAIARAIVEAHDGAITVENRMAGGQIAGARFTVALAAA